MPEPDRQPVLEQIVLVVFVSAGVGAFGSSFHTPAWLLLLPGAVSPLWKIRRFPAGMAAWTRYAAYAWLSGASVLGFIFMAYPVLAPQTALRLTLAAGYGLSFFAVLFLMGTPVWPPARTLFPSAFGTLVVACFNPSAILHGLIATAAAALFVYLALATRPFADRLLRLAFSGLGTFLIAWAIIWFLPWAQGRVEKVTLSLFLSQKTGYSGLSFVSKLGDLEELKLSKKVVMRVWSTRPQKLRGRVFTRFDGQRWFAPGFANIPLKPAPPDPLLSQDLAEWLEAVPGNLFFVPGSDAREPAGPRAIRTKIVQEAFNDGMLVSPGQTSLVRAPLATMSVNSLGILGPPASSTTEIYGVLNRRSGEVAQPGVPVPEILKQCLALPEDTEPRLKELAARLAVGTHSAEERIRRTVSFVENECHYSLQVGKFSSSQPVAEFLFEKKRGFCQYFASAAVVLFRLEGVPARYVTGFEVQEGNRVGDHYVVRESDAHAWVEAYVPGQGWVEADPTPVAEYQALHADLKNGWAETAWEWLRAELAELFVRVRGGDWMAAPRWLWRQVRTLARGLFTWRFVAVLLFAVAAWMVAMLVKRSRQAALKQGRLPAGRETSQETSAELAGLMARLDSLWAGRGFVRPASRAPLEHLDSIPPEKMPPALREASRKAVECFYRSCFGGAPTVPEDIRQLRRSLERAGRSKG